VLYSRGSQWSTTILGVPGLRKGGDNMTPRQFREWRDQLALSLELAGRLLGVPELFEQPPLPSNDLPAKIPSTVERRCKHLALQRRLFDELKVLENAEVTKRESHGGVNIDKVHHRIRNIRNQLFEIDVILLLDGEPSTAASRARGSSRPLG
jgi:hypothetical protein